MSLPKSQKDDSPSKIHISRAAPTPLGPVWIAESEQGLVTLGMGSDPSSFTQKIAKRHKAKIIPMEDWTHQASRSSIQRAAHSSVQQAARQVREYLSGEQQNFSLPIDWSVMTSFQEQVLRATKTIPRGETRTYAEIAAQIGKPNAARAVGRAEASNPMPLVIPCHRVIGADGSLHGYSAPGGLETKAWLLKLEGALPKTSG